MGIKFWPQDGIQQIGDGGRGGISVSGGSADINTTAPAITPTIEPTELLGNNTFASDTVWTKGTGWTITPPNGVGTLTSSSLRQAVLTAGNWYQVIWDLVSRTAGSCQGFAGIGGALQTVPATYTMTGRATNANAGVNGVGFSGTVTNIYCKKLTFATMLALLGNIGRKNGTYICHPTVAVSSQCGFVIEYLDINNLVAVYVNRSNPSADLVKLIGGTWTSVITGAITYSAAVELKVIVSGANHSLYYNGAQVGSTTAINDTLGTSVYGFNSLAGNTVGVVTTSP